MVEKAHPRSGYIHWTVAVIPLGCVIVVLLCVIGFLLWRLKQATKNQNVEITVNAIHYDLHTKSILNPEGGAKNKKANHTRVHFEEPNKYEDPRCLSLEPVKKNTTGCKGYVSARKNQTDHEISRRLAIRRKNNEGSEGKYSLNKNGEDYENEIGVADLSGDTSNPGDEGELTDVFRVADYACPKPDGASESEGGITEKQADVNCSNDKLPYLEIIQE